MGVKGGKEKSEESDKVQMEYKGGGEESSSHLARMNVQLLCSISFFDITQVYLMSETHFLPLPPLLSSLLLLSSPRLFPLLLLSFLFSSPFTCAAVHSSLFGPLSKLENRLQLDQLPCPCSQTPLAHARDGWLIDEARAVSEHHATLGVSAEDGNSEVRKRRKTRTGEMCGGVEKKGDRSRIVDELGEQETYGGGVGVGQEGGEGEEEPASPTFGGRRGSSSTCRGSQTQGRN